MEKKDSLFKLMDNFDHPKVSLVVGTEIVHKTGRLVVKSHVKFHNILKI